MITYLVPSCNLNIMVGINSPQSSRKRMQLAQVGLPSSHLTFLLRHVRQPVLRFGPERPVPLEWIGSISMIISDCKHGCSISVGDWRKISICGRETASRVDTLSYPSGHVRNQDVASNARFQCSLVVSSTPSGSPQHEDPWCRNFDRLGARSVEEDLSKATVCIKVVTRHG